ncbi:glycosyltransferase, partial [Alphaproteobacteria bacterium]|nr:glycosyltransferase [Alphaproteobacteria bacterium]
LIESFKEAKYIYKNIELYIAGSLDEKNPTGISKNKLNNFLKIKGIRYFGNVKDVRELWSKSNIAILLSKREGLPLSLMEAAAVGRAIIATNVPGCREIAIHKYNSITVEPGDIISTRDAILELSKNKKVRRHYAENSRKLVESDMSLVNICKQYYKLYNSL